jgi:hypothetical protein
MLAFQDEVDLLLRRCGEIVDKHPRPGAVEALLVILARGEREARRAFRLRQRCGARAAESREVAAGNEAVEIDRVGVQSLEDDAQRVVRRLGHRHRFVEDDFGKVGLRRDLDAQFDRIVAAVVGGDTRPQNDAVGLWIA